MAGLKRWVSEVMVYDADDRASTDEANEFVASNQEGAWTVDAVGIRGAAELGPALQGYVNIQQLSFSTHGYPGGVWFPHGSLESANLKTVTVSSTLFHGPGRLLFMGCETARTKAGEEFLKAAGRHFFAGKGGIVAGTTVYNLGFSSGTRLWPWMASSGGWAAGHLILYRLGAAGNVVARDDVKPGLVGLP